MSYWCSEYKQCTENGMRVEIKGEVEMFIIAMSAHSHMLRGSIMKTSMTKRGERKQTLYEARQLWLEALETHFS